MRIFLIIPLAPSFEDYEKALDSADRRALVKVQTLHSVPDKQTFSRKGFHIPQGHTQGGGLNPIPRNFCQTRKDVTKCI